MANSSTNESVRSQFGGVAGAYAASSVHAAGPDLPLFVAAAELTGSELVLDLGSGAGHSTLAMAAKAKEATGLDLTPEMVAEAEQLAAQRGVRNVSYRQGDAAKMPFANGSFDVVTTRYSAHHYADPQAVLAEAFRVLKPGGRFVMVDTVAPEDPALDSFCQAFELLRDPSHVRNCRASEWLRLLAAAGLPGEVVERLPVVLDGADWVARMRTPEPKVAILRTLFREATPSQRAAFDLRDEPWGLSIPVAVIRGRKAG
jgi:SAM-dependent methyltransferase